MSDAVEVNPVIAGQPQRPTDAEVAALAERQHGVVGRRQLDALGVGRGALEHRLAEGRLHALHRGVYAVGHRVVSREGRWMAAVLAMGSEAVLSHRSAAALWGIRPTARGRIEVIVPGSRQSRPTLQVHRARLAGDEVTTARGIPVTTPNRTLLDLAAVLDARHVEKAINEGEILRLTNPNSLGDLVERHPRRKGIGALRSVLAAHAIGSTITRSELEDRFLQFLDEAALRTPQVNANIKIADRWIEADCVWPDDRLIVELDGRATHATPAAFERDRARDRVLQAAGWRVVRVTWRQLHDESVRLTSDLRKLLAE